MLFMDGIDEILRAEQEAVRIRRSADEAAEALLGSADGFRQDALETARREGDSEKTRLLADAEKRAQTKRKELRILADVRNDELRQKAAERLDAVAVWIAERIAGF